MKTIHIPQTILLCFLLLCFFTVHIPISSAMFSDVDHNNQYYDAIEYVQSSDIVHGYEDGTYHPNSLIRRDEFLKIIIESQFNNADIEACATSPFYDTSEYWVSHYTCIAYNNGIIHGYPDGSFKPTLDISIAEAAKIISNTFDYTIIEDNNNWWNPFIQKLEQKQAIPVSIDAVHSKVTRGEVAEIIYRLKNNIVDKPSKKLIESYTYEPFIDPQNFTSTIDNPYMSFIPGRKMIFEGNTEDGVEKIEIYTTHKTKNVMGVETRIVWDRVWLNNELREDTEDWLAQDTKGNVWYFGEISKTVLDGKIIHTEGSWEAGIDGAQPGIIMPGNPEVGNSYISEYLPGEAEDMIDILGVHESITTSYGTFYDCIKTRDWTALDVDADEHKFHCKETQGFTLEIGLEDGETVELVGVTESTDEQELDSNTTTLTTRISEEEAKEIALKKVPGRITGIEIERKFGKVTFVVEVDAEQGGEIDVIINAETGEVLAVES